MKIIGLLGGMSWESTALYYRIINETVRDRLASRFGLDVLTPSPDERDVVHRVIYDELCLGRVNADSRAAFRSIIASIVDRGAEAIILGCTEITMLVTAQDSPVPVFDTTQLHAVAAAEWATKGPFPDSAQHQLQN